jgi:hypothetical protein
MDAPFTTLAEKDAAAEAPPIVEFIRWEGEHRTIAVQSIDGKGSISIPYLSWRRAEDGRLTLILDDRLAVDLPEMHPRAEFAVIEVIANAIAVGAGYGSIYYTKRKVPFRG